MLLDGLVGPGVVVRECSLDGRTPSLFPEEMAAIANAVDRRRREFAAGRACARDAFAALGLPAVAIPSGADRAPVWPQGVAGSISHSGTWCVAAVARQLDGVVSLGVDIEEAVPLDQAFALDICTPFERDWLDLQPHGERGLLLKVLFSAKECAYKCQYPLTLAFLEYDAMSIELDLAAGSFRARFEIEAGSFKAGDALDGRVGIANGHIACFMVLRYDPWI